MSRTIPTWYTADDDLDIELPITVEASADGPRDILIETDLPAMSVSAENQLRERVAELYWAAERVGYRRAEQARLDLA